MAQVKRVTSVDVARLAGVAQSTVSLVINNKPNSDVSPETRARVLAAIAELGYHPHEGARSLRMRASHIIGFAAPEDANEHYHDLAAGVESFAREQGYSVFRSVTHWNPHEERTFLQLLTQQRVDGLIFSYGTEQSVFPDIATLRHQGQPIVGLGFEHDFLDTVVEATGGEAAVIEHLAELGHRRIGYIYGVADQVTLGNRLTTCLALQEAAGIPVDERWIKRCGPTREDGYRATQELLAATTAQERPTALVVVNDFVATSVCAALAAAGLHIPDDISIVSFDNTAQATYCWPPLTSVDGQSFQRGALVARLLIERLANPDAPIQHLHTQARLVVRASTGQACS